MAMMKYAKGKLVRMSAKEEKDLLAEQAAWKAADDEKAKAKQVEGYNQALADIDGRTIRAIREGNTKRLAAYDKMAQLTREGKQAFIDGDIEAAASFQAQIIAVEELLRKEG